MVHFSAMRSPRLATHISCQPASAKQVKFGANSANGDGTDKSKGWSWEADEGEANVWTRSKPYRIAAGAVLSAIGLSALAALGGLINQALNHDHDNPKPPAQEIKHDGTQNPGMNLDTGTADFRKEP